MRKAHARGGLLALGFAVLLACGGGGGDADPTPPSWPLGSEDAFGGEVPACAVPCSPEEFAAGIADGSLTVVTEAQIARQEQDALDRAALDRARAEEIYAADPGLLARHVAEPDPANPDYEPLPDGNWRVRVRRADPASGRAEQWVVLQGSRYAYGELVHVHERYHSQENQLGVYRTLYRHLEADAIERLDLPDPSVAIEYSFEALEALNQKIAMSWTTIDPASGGKPTGWPVSAWNEEGHGGGDDATYPTHPGMWPQIDFTLKWRATSVKAQGRRGSCVAFGITAAVEAVIARDRDRWVNLSEQMLYNRAKQKWWPSTFGDGLYTGTTIGMMSVSDYRYTWEDTWDYNPSWSRADAVWFYVNSCVGYAGQPCSDANHQAELVTTTVGGFEFCAYRDAGKDVPADAGFEVDEGNLLWSVASVGVEGAKAALAAGVPIVISCTVSTTMREPLLTSDGIVTFNPILAGSGGHAMALMGYVENADLPPGTPPGAGGGYFVCKNSWGSGYGDGGYCYLPDSWVAFWAKGLYVIDHVVGP